MTTEVLAQAMFGNFGQVTCFLSHTALPASARNDNTEHANNVAYNQGFDARERGKAFISCPYSLGTSPDLWASWRRGWTKADILSDDVAFMRVP